MAEDGIPKVMEDTKGMAADTKEAKAEKDMAERVGAEMARERPVCMK